VDNPDGFWSSTDQAEGLEAVAFNEDIHAVFSAILLHLSFLQCITTGLRESDPALQGESGFILSVDPDGRVTSAVPDPDQPGNATLGRRTR